MFATGLGHEMPAVLAVTCAVMGGMGLGAWSLDKAISRSERPGRWYTALETIIGGWAFLSTLLIPLANKAALPLMGIDPSPLRHWTVAFLLPFLAILPATAAMGATFPAMERFIAPLSEDRRCIGGIYAANTFGAVAGVLLGVFVIAPALGFRASVWCFGLVSVVCGLAVVGVWQSIPPARTADSKSRESASPAPPQSLTPAMCNLSARRLKLTIFCAGLLGVGYETAVIRVLSQVLENTVYTFAAVLAVFLLGTSVGAAAYQRYGRRFASRLWLSELSIACLLGGLALSRAQRLYDACRSAFGDNPSGVLMAEVSVALAAFGLPTVFMGAIFSHLVQAARSDQGGVGRAAAINTFGGALAPAFFRRYSSVLARLQVDADRAVPRIPDVAAELDRMAFESRRSSPRLPVRPASRSSHRKHPGRRQSD